MRVIKASRASLLIAGALGLASAARAQTVAVTGATIIDGTGKEPIRDGVVLIKDGRFAAVGTTEEVSVPASATKIDARGKYVIPGLMDANLHLMLNIDLETLIRYEGRFEEIVLEGAQIALKTGQTTVFDTWGPRVPLVNVRDMINRGEAVGSRIYLAGNIIGFDGPISADFVAGGAAYVSKAFTKRINAVWEEGTGRRLMWMTPEEVRTVIREYAAKDLDFLKYGATGHQEMQFISFSPRVQKILVEEAHRAGKTIQAHTSSREGLDLAIEAGLDILTHCETSGANTPIPPETIQKMVERKVPCSTLPMTQRHLDLENQYNRDALMTPFQAIKKQNQRNMIKAGAILLLSTDAGIQNPVSLAESKTLAVDSVESRVKLGDAHFNGLLALEQMGMQPMEILKSATSHIARAYKLEKDIGTVEPGKRADLVILNQDPLASARNYRSIHTVIKDGKAVDIANLPTKPVISSMKVVK